MRRHLRWLVLAGLCGVTSSCVTTTSSDWATLASAAAMGPSYGRPAAHSVPLPDLAAELGPRRELGPIAAAAPETSKLALGLEVQGYPAGVIAGVHLQRQLGERDALTFRLAWNETDRRDFGEHDDETGGGFGGGVGYRRWLAPDREGWMWGGRLDLWDLEIDWVDDPPSAAKGRTDVLVLQPTIEGGYSWNLGDSAWRCDLVAGFGFEINVDTNGEDVGEGAIGLLGVTLVRSL